MSDDIDMPAGARLDSLRARLGLSPHPEGGFFREHYRGADSPRGSSSAIYFLLPEGHCSAWHRVAQDELWHHYEGAPVELHLIDEEEGYRVRRLGALEEDTQPCVVVRGGVWQAARPLGAYALVGNTVAPGFQFADWTLADEEMRSALALLHPAAATALHQLGRVPT